MYLYIRKTQVLYSYHHHQCPSELLLKPLPLSVVSTFILSCFFILFCALVLVRASLLSIAWCGNWELSMAARSLLVASLLLLSCFAETCHGVVLFSSLQRTLLVTASPKQGEVLKAGENNITVSWGLNQTFPAGTDSAYKTIKVKLCYAPISQVDRAWRKTVDNLSKDKTCQFNIVTGPYNRSNSTTSTIIVEKDVPTATYFVRAYAYDSQDHEVAYGQTTDGHKTTNLFDIQAITGRHVSLDLASACFSAFSVLALLGFFFMEKRKSKVSQLQK